MWLLASAIGWAAEPQELALGEALDRLEAAGPDLAQVAARADAARAVAREARAAWMPLLVATGSYTRNDSEVVLGFSDLAASLPVPIDLPGDVTIQPLEVWNAGISARVPLFAPAAWSDARAAARGADSAASSAEEARLQLQQALVAAAAGVEAAAGVVEAATRAEQVAEEHLESLKRAEIAGTATPLDRLSAQADVARRQGELAQAKADLAGVEDRLGALLGIDGPVVVKLPDAGGEAGDGVPRASIAAAEAQIRAAKAEAAGAWWRLAPTVAATGTALAATVPFATGNETAWKIGLEATWTLYDGGFRYGRLDQARADLAAATAVRDAAVLASSRETRAAERDVEVATQRLSLAEEQSRLAAQASEVAARGLSAGTVSPLQSRDIDADAFRAEVGVVAARAELRIAVASLRRARGLDQRW